MPEGLSPAEVGKEIAEHREHTEHSEHAGEHGSKHDRLISVVEAVMLSLVALLAAWSGYSAAKWGSQSSVELAKAQSARSESSLAEIQATQIRTLDSVSFNAVEGAYVSNNPQLLHLSLRRIRAGAQPAVKAWLALHPLKNPNAPADPSDMPQYRIPQDAQAKILNAQANTDFSQGETDSGTADKYVRITVLLAAVLFLIGIGSRFPVRAARYGLIGVATVLLVISLVQLLGLPAPPSS